ncbi:hypothetical protein BJ742DRAFT_858477 [Cladochytrium replicatum]|nr:hypothetical protein BJ742DRAFT_858477 [Cladochytrium replicatum]
MSKFGRSKELSAGTGGFAREEGKKKIERRAIVGGDIYFTDAAFAAPRGTGGDHHDARKLTYGGLEVGTLVENLISNSYPKVAQKDFVRWRQQWAINVVRLTLAANIRLYRVRAKQYDVFGWKPGFPGIVVAPKYGNTLITYVRKARALRLKSPAASAIKQTSVHICLKRHAGCWEANVTLLKHYVGISIASVAAALAKAKSRALTYHKVQNDPKARSHPTCRIKPTKHGQSDHNIGFLDRNHHDHNARRKGYDDHEHCDRIENDHYNHYTSRFDDHYRGGAHDSGSKVIPIVIVP